MGDGSSTIDPSAPESPTDSALEPAGGPSTSTRLAAWVFGIYVVVALPLVVFGLGRYYWFGTDDWDFLAERQIGSLSDLFRPHAEHWSTLPVITERLEWHLFGFHYSAYQAVTMTLHLITAVLLRVVMRRNGVQPWIATVAAGLFVLFSPGSQNMLWSFQIGMVGSMLFGFTHLILADHDGDEVRRNDWLGLLAGLAGLMCSGIGPAMVGVVGLAVLIRRGWRMALFHTVPLALVFVAWYLAERDEQPGVGANGSPLFLFRWVREGLIGTFEALGYGVILGAVLAIGLVVGLGLAWAPLVRRSDWGALRRSAAVPVATLAGAIGFQVVTANSRVAFGPLFALSSRYLYVVALLLLPALAVAADALARQWRYGLPVVLVVLLLPVPGTIRSFDARGTPLSPSYFERERDIIEALAWAPEAELVDPNARPARRLLGAEGPPIGWLVQARRDGKIDDPGPLEPALADEVLVRLGVAQWPVPAGEDPTAGFTCRTYDQPLDLDPQKGDEFTILSGVGIRPRTDHPSYLAPAFNPLNGQRLRIALDDLHLRLTPLGPATTFELCSG